MQAQKILIAIILILLVIGAGLFGWYLLLPAPPPATTSTNLPGLLDTQGPGGAVGDTQGGGGDTTPVYPTTGQNPPVVQPGSTPTTTQGAAPVDLNHEYALLFSKLAGQEIAFTASTGLTAKTSALYALYSADVDLEKKSYPTKKDFPLDIAFVDLNNDGVDEALVYENLDYFCGSGGCPLDVYVKQGGTWQNILSTITYEHIGVLAQGTSGFRNIFIPQQGDVGFQTKVNRWIWYGTAYKSVGAEAYWNGKTFITGQ